MIDYKKDPSSFYINAIASLNLHPEDLAVYRQAVLTCDNCFAAAKQNKMEEAASDYEMGSLFFEQANPVLLTWLTAFCSPRMAYYHYRQKHHDEAIALTEKIIEALKLLQSENNYRYLFFPQIQQMHNLSRIYFTMNNMRRAVAICSEAIVQIFMEAGGRESTLLIEGVPEEAFVKITRYDMLIQVMAETCNTILQKYQEDPVLQEELLKLFITPLRELDFSRISDDPRYTAVTAFVRVMSLLVNDDEELGQNDIHFFIKNEHADKALLRVLFKYVNQENRQAAAA